MSGERLMRSLSSCKIGTIPALVYVHGRDLKRIAPGKRIRVREQQGQDWMQVLVTSVSTDGSGYFFADR